MNLKTKLIAISLALISLAIAQDASPKITYSTVAVPVSRALQEIGKQASVKLEATPQVANEILILSVKDITLEILMKRIATALSAEWQPFEGGYRLVPNNVVRRQEEQAEHAEYTANINKSIQEMVKSLNPPKPDPNKKDKSPEEMAMMTGFGLNASNNPAGKAVIRLLQAIGATNLASVDERSRVVYSSNPTRMQRALPGNTNQILAQLVTEHNAHAQQRQKSQKERAERAGNDDSEQMKKMEEIFGSLMDDDRPIEGTPTKAILAITRRSLFGGLTANLKVFNEKGKVVVTGSQTIHSDLSFLTEIMADMAESKKPQTKAPDKKEKAIELSDISKELLSSANFMDMAKAPPMSEALRTRLLNPEQYDHLSFVHSEALLGIAKQRNAQLVAVLPDTVESLITAIGEQDTNLTPTSYLKDIEGETKLTEETGWMIIRPAKPAKARRNRFDRAALGTFIRAVDSKGSCSLDDLALYATKAPSPMEDQSTMRYFMLFAPNALQTGFTGMTSWDALRFYGALPAMAKRNLIEGGQIPFSQLNPTQAAAVRQMAFGPEANLVTDSPEKKNAFEMPAMFQQMMMRNSGSDFRTEPTEVMPNGLPADGFVVLKFTNDQVAKAAGNLPPYIANAALGADELAMFKYLNEGQGMEQFASMMPRIEDVKLGSRKIYEFKFMVAPGVSMTQTLNDDSFDKNAKVVNMANLPEDFKKKIQERLAMFKKIPFLDPEFMNGGRTVPPSP